MMCKNCDKNDVFYYKDGTPSQYCTNCVPEHMQGDLPDAKDHINPDHYKSGGLECIDVIESFELNFCLGNVLKYLLRAGKKDSRSQDLNKALWYLQREIDSEKTLPKFTRK